MTRYALINPLREPKETKTRSEAWLMGGHTAMVMVEGVAGGVMVESVKPPKDPSSPTHQRMTSLECADIAARAEALALIPGCEFPSRLGNHESMTPVDIRRLVIPLAWSGRNNHPEAEQL